MAAPVGEFFSVQPDKTEMVVSWRKTTADQGLYYLDHQREFISKYAGNYILLQMGEVRWSDPTGNLNASRRVLSGLHPEQGMWMKFVDPDEKEHEHFEVYQKTLDNMKSVTEIAGISG